MNSEHSAVPSPSRRPGNQKRRYVAVAVTSAPTAMSMVTA